MTLSNFHGEPKSWQPFWDSFSAAIHKNKSVTKVEKFNYLKSYLKVEAASAISGLSLTAENYDVAIELLKDRFFNPHVISSHMDELLQLRAVEESTKTRDIVNIDC